MTNEEIELLLKDICARLPYGVKIHGPKENDNILWELDYNMNIKKIVDDGWLPYLRPISSITKDEAKEYYETMDKYTHRLYPNSCDWSEHTEYSWTIETFNWLNAHHFDYRGLIDKGLALPAPDGMYNFK